MRPNSEEELCHEKSCYEVNQWIQNGLQCHLKEVELYCLFDEG
jgi:hypothetical protein